MMAEANPNATQDHNTTERSKGKEKLTSEESPDADTDADGDASADTDHAEANYTDLDRADATGDHTNADVDEEHSEEINTKVSFPSALSLSHPFLDFSLFACTHRIMLVAGRAAH
jgi:hypothetical protein